MAKDKFADEMLTDDELDGVAGGSIGQTSGDSKILYDYGLMDRYYGTIPVMFYPKIGENTPASKR